MSWKVALFQVLPYGFSGELFPPESVPFVDGIGFCLLRAATDQSPEQTQELRSFPSLTESSGQGKSRITTHEGFVEAS